MTAVIICNGNIRDYTYYKKYLDKADFVMCVDGGAAHARKLGVRPDILLGDFDSIAVDDFNYFKDSGVDTLTFPAEKDMTDTELAVSMAIDRGYKVIIIIGGLGTRFDHSLSNVFLLKKMHDSGVKGIIADEHNEINLVGDVIRLQKEENTKVTILPLTPTIEGVTTKGLYYPLDDATIDMSFSRGVSNEFADETAEISIKKGLMLVIKSRD